MKAAMSCLFSDVPARSRLHALSRFVANPQLLTLG
jgi:hypothetical protein